MWIVRLVKMRTSPAEKDSVFQSQLNLETPVMMNTIIVRIVIIVIDSIFMMTMKKVLRTTCDEGLVT